MSVQMMIASVAAATMTGALATGGVGVKSASQAVEAMRTKPAGKPTSAKTKYCVMTNSTGSRIERKLCRTRSEWLAEGFDPLTDK